MIIDDSVYVLVYYCIDAWTYCIDTLLIAMLVEFYFDDGDDMNMPCYCFAALSCQENLMNVFMLLLVDDAWGCMLGRIMLFDVVDAMKIMNIAVVCFV